jgi:uncharacterized protein (TIGR00251 family)
MQAVSAIEEKDGSVWIRVRVQPKASREGVTGEAQGRIRIALTAPPVDGEANAALVAFIAKTLGLPKRGVEITAGTRGREKTIRVEGLRLIDVRAKLTETGRKE